jgi:hypothetical protein
MDDIVDGNLAVTSRLFAGCTTYVLRWEAPGCAEEGS